MCARACGFSKSTNPDLSITFQLTIFDPTFFDPVSFCLPDKKSKKPEKTLKNWPFWVTTLKFREKLVFDLKKLCEFTEHHYREAPRFADSFTEINAISLCFA